MKPTLSLALALLGAACSSDPAGDASIPDAADLDAGARDAAPGDAAPSDATVEDAALPDAAVTTDGGVTDGGVTVFGFTLRRPTTRELPCTGHSCPGATVPAEDIDYVCDLRYGALDRYVYVQAHGTSWLDFGGYIYEVDGAWISDGTQITGTTTAVYNWGGNHHNDSLVVDVPGYQVRYDHSSFGYGFRVCQPMDCLVVYEPGPGDELANGCGRDRTVPAICKRVAADGTIDAWTDTFARCAGDT